MLAAPLVPMVSASDSIGLSLDPVHLVATPGEAQNVTLSIHNNGTSIETFEIEVLDSSLNANWEVIAATENETNVFPTYVRNTTIVVRLAEDATPSDSTSVNIKVSKQSDSTVFTTITLQLSVAPIHAAGIDVSGLGTSGLVTMAPGDSLDLTVPVSNEGNMIDTLLLSIEDEPDLAEFWANWTAAQEENESEEVSMPADILMYGNSYTASNSLDAILQELMRNRNGTTNVSSNTGGGLRLDQHWDRVNTSANPWNTSLASKNWDYVVLQDQSQIPGFYRNNSQRQASNNGSINLAERINSSGSETVLMMTWGRRAGDSVNSHIYSNFSNMQDRLKIGYEDYRDNMTAVNNNTVWIAPVGLAFEHIHDAVNATGTNPTNSGNLFYDLYTSDGSHPSLKGSYLTACVLLAALTGVDPVELNDTISINAATKLQLQQAAAATVFNETNYSYPWQTANNTTSTSSIISQPPATTNLPAGWQVRWLDDIEEDMTAGESRLATLRITVPSDEVPGSHGFRLFAASTKANSSVSTVLVVNISATYQLSFGIPSGMLLPGQTSQAKILVSNDGSADAIHRWTIESVTGPCDLEMPLLGPMIATGESEEIQFNVSVLQSASVDEICDMRLSAKLKEDNSVISQHDFAMSISQQRDVLISFETEQSITPEVTKEMTILVTNNGTEEDEFRLTTIVVEGIDVSLPASQVLASGSSAQFTIGITAQAGLSGLVQQPIAAQSLNDLSISASNIINLTIAEVGDLVLTGPADSRIILTPESYTLTAFNVSNTGTSNLTLVPGMTGLPIGVSATWSPSTLNLMPCEQGDMVLNLSADSTAQPDSNALTIAIGGSGAQQSIPITLLISDRDGVKLTSTTDKLIGGSTTSGSLTIFLTNTGTANETYLVELDSSSADDWTTSLSLVSITLDSGESTNLTLSALHNGVTTSSTVILSATSTADEEVSTSLTITLEPQVADSSLAILFDDDSALPGETIHGSVVLTNTGNGEDIISLEVVGMSCGLSNSHTLQAGESTASLPFSCVLSTTAVAGDQALEFRAMSTVNPSMVSGVSKIYTVETTWDTPQAVIIGFSDNEINMERTGGSSLTLSLENTANIAVSGKMDVLGMDQTLFVIEFVDMLTGATTEEFTLPANGKASYKMTIDTLSSEPLTTTLNVRFTSSISGSVETSESPDLLVEVTAPEGPPGGIDFGFASIDNQTSMGMLASGWILALLTLLVLRFASKKEDEDAEVEEEEEEVEEEEEKELADDECRVEDGGRISCPKCEMRLGVPAGSEPPFRFSCPSCSERISVVI